MTVLDEPRVRFEQRPTDAGGGYGHLDPDLAEFARLAPHDPRRRALRDRLAEAFLPVVEHLALRYRGRSEPMDDLVQVGAIGLLKALDRFDPELGSAFLSFAIPTITGEMRRYFRDRAWAIRVPRRLKDLQAPVREAVAALSGELGRAPRPSDVAERLGVDVEEVIEALRAQDAYRPSSLDALSGASDRPLGELIGQADAAIEQVEYRLALRRVLAELPERERTILVLRFFGDLTQTQIAERIGISQMHVSRLLSQTLAGLRKRLDKD